MQGDATMTPLGQTMWADQIARLPLRPPPTLDETRDEQSAQVKRDRLKAIREGRARQAIEQAAETEQKIIKLANKSIVCIDDLRNGIGMSAHHLRQVAMSMVEDGRLQVVVGSYGKKYWRAKK